MKIARDVRGQTGPGNWGNYVLLAHADGTCTRYAHMKYGSVIGLATGKPVFQGQQLGLVGNTGYTIPAGRGHHLHWQRENCSTNVSIETGFAETGGAVLAETQSYTSQNNQYEGKIVRRADGVSWVVRDARRRHIPDFSTDVCAAWSQQLPSVVLSDAQLAAIPEVSVKYACDLNGTVLRASDGPDPLPSYRFYGNERHLILDEQTFRYWSNQPGSRVVNAPRSVLQDARLKTGAEEPRRLYAPDQEGSILRRTDGVSWVIKGGKRLHIPDYPTDLCAHYAENRTVLGGLAQSQVGSIPEASGKHVCSLDRRILRSADRPDPKPSYAFHHGKRYAIGDPWTYDFLVRAGYQVLDAPYNEIVDGRLPNGGTEPPKLDPRSIPPVSIVRRADGVSWVVDQNRVRHHIPYQQDDVCWRNLGGRGFGPLGVSATGLTSSQASSVGKESDAWPCIIGMRVVKSSDGSSHLVDQANARHAIPDVDTFWALVRKFGPALGPWPASDVNALPEGPPQRQMLDPEAVKNSIVCRNDGVCWAVDGNAVRHHIPSYGDNVCWRWVNGWKVSRSNVNSDQAASLSEAEPWGCSMDNRIIATNEGPAYYMSGNTRRWIPDGYDFECLQRGRAVIRGMSLDEAGKLAEGAAMPAQECSGIDIVTIFSPANSRYVTTEINYSGNDYAMVRAARTSVGSDWERFRLIGNCASRCLIQSLVNRKLV
ncbi:MAG TPA: M23 family metallopeptidase, partial [Nocardioides sp.]|nr:M23 family metallopeptidase [Nocardioides sp.]